MNTPRETELPITPTEYGIIITMPNGVECEVVDLLSAGKSATQYIQDLLASGDKPNVIAVTPDDAEALDKAATKITKRTTGITWNKPKEHVEIVERMITGTRITAQSMIKLNQLMIYRQKPPTQGVAIMGELAKLLDDAGVSTEGLK